MATFIFFGSYLLFVYLFYTLTSLYFLPLWIFISLIPAFFFMLFCYLLNYPLVLLLPPKNRYKSYLMRSISFFLNRFILRLRIKVTGLHHVPKDGPLVIYANHKSYTDAFALLEVLSRPITLTPKKSVMKLPIVGAWLKSYDVFPINRNDARETAKDLEKAIETVKGGHAILVFPEGSIKNRESNLIETMKPGSFKLAYKAEATILMVKYEGNDLVRKRAYKLKKSNRRLTILEPLTYEMYKHLTTQEIANLVMQKMNSI
jgi:1-acyl-sn-glycerol-3-phosphate acyltransferase